MTRRGAILAALLGGVTRPVRAQRRAVWQRIEIPQRPLGSVITRLVPCNQLDTDAARAYGPGMKCEQRIEPEPYEWALEITYKNRTVRLTGDELMDALEGAQ